MATTIPLSLGSYTMNDARASSKRLVGCFSELADQDSPADVKNKVQPAYLRRMAGISSLTGFTDGTGNPVRGMWEMAGLEYVVIGPNLYSATIDAVTNIVTLSAVLNPNNPILGSSFVRMTDNGACMVILVPGTRTAWTYSLGGGFQNLTSTFFLTQGAVDCWFIDTFIVFLSLSGTSFFNDDGRQVSGNNQITFTTAASFTREFGTDPFVGGCVDHRTVVLLGSRTSEAYVNAGNPTGSPFASAPDGFMQQGCHPSCAYTVALQDQSVFWVANDLTVRRRNGQTPLRVSNSGVEQILQNIASPNGKSGTLTGAYALTPTVSGHPLWILTMPNAISPEGFLGRTLVYDCLTQKWFELESFGGAAGTTPLGCWRVLSYHNGMGRQLLGDSQTSQVGMLDVDAFSEYGATQICSWTTQLVYDGNNRIQHRRLEVVVTAGETPSTTATPTIDIHYSDDYGGTFTSVGDVQNLGSQGQFDQRAFAFNTGQSRARIYRMRVTDPTPLFTVDVQATLEGGKW